MLGSRHLHIITTEVCMQTLQHLCGQMVNVTVWQSHGETILDVSDLLTGEQLDTCPECGEEFFQNTLFPLDIFPMIAAEELAVSLAEEV